MLPEIPPAVALAAALALALAGQIALARSMRRYQGQLWSAPPAAGSRRLWRAAGACELLAAYGVCIMGWGISVGLVVFAGLAGAAGAALAFALPYAPRAVRLAAFMAPVLGAILTAAGLA